MAGLGCRAISADNPGMASFLLAQMDVPSGDLLSKLLDQGAALTLALIMFVVWYKTRQNERDRDHAHMERLESLIRERKDAGEAMAKDRDRMLTVLTKIELHLARSDYFEEFAREALRSAEAGPQRRQMDRLLADALDRVDREARRTPATS